jgi:hypothetical protein
LESKKQRNKNSKLNPKIFFFFYFFKKEYKNKNGEKMEWICLICGNRDYEIEKMRKHLEVHSFKELLIMVYLNKLVGLE